MNCIRLQVKVLRLEVFYLGLTVEFKDIVPILASQFEFNAKQTGFAPRGQH